MASTLPDEMAEGISKLIGTVNETTERAIESMRKFVETVNDVFPDLGEDGPRRKIIDSAFKMTEQVVNASSNFAEKIVETTRDATKRVAGSPQ